MRRRKKPAEEVELNLAAMLDMAFQLLTFFILTFKPAPVEGQISLRMPPPQPVVAAAKNAPKAGDNDKNKDPVAGLNSLVITVVGNSAGRLEQIAVGEGEPLRTVRAFESRLKSVLSDPGVGFEQVIIQVGASLHYDELMSVVDACTRQTLPNGEKLTKLSFVELPGG